ncbi:MAG: hypothetical protein GY867_09540 [bacterium]|nr:hypothetical protein [bacterium]
MMRKTILRQALLLVPAVLLVLTVMPGCDSAGVNTQVASSYRVEGGLVLDLNLDSTFVSVGFERNDTLLVGAAVWYGIDSLRFNDPQVCVCNAYSACTDSVLRYAAASPNLIVKDDDRFQDTLSRVVVDTFSITNLVPGNHLIQGNDQVSLEWGGATNADAYVLAAVKTSKAYTGEGYSLYTPLASTAGTIPPDAFLIEGTNEADTGLYNIYVYALNGAPDSALTAYKLPVPLPHQISDDVSERPLTGRLGSVMVALRDTVRVAQQQ